MRSIGGGRSGLMGSRRRRKVEVEVASGNGSDVEGI
jgi:hypothetical protein